MQADETTERDETDQTGTILLLTSSRNEPLGVDSESVPGPDAEIAPGSTLPADDAPLPRRRRRSRSLSFSLSRSRSRIKRTTDGRIVLDPQPTDSANDPLNWPVWRRDAALLSLGFYCALGGGMTPVLAPAYNSVAQAFGVGSSQVALTTGFYMLGCGWGSVVMSPTALLVGKRPVYLVSALLFVGTTVWCGSSPTYGSLLAARIIQGIAQSPVECLPSATIAEIFFLHERAYRVGTYTLLLLGGKNLMPLISAAIVQGLNWRWIFWILSMVIAFGGMLLLVFVPETFWDRTPRPRQRRRSRSHIHLPHLHVRGRHTTPKPIGSARPRGEAEQSGEDEGECEKKGEGEVMHHESRPRKQSHVEFAERVDIAEEPHGAPPIRQASPRPATPRFPPPSADDVDLEAGRYSVRERSETPARSQSSSQFQPPLTRPQAYTNALQDAPRKTFVQAMRPWNGRISHGQWFKLAFRPFVLFAYPAVLWSAAVYALSVGWLIVLSEAVSAIYRNKATYNFSALGSGLVYISPFIGGVLGTAVAGRLSDLVVRTMTRRNGGVYEPEFRLLMALPIAVTTAVGLMGFGWSAQVHDAWIVPTVFFGVLSFGCSFGSTTAITFCVDSYRQYAGEALVTLNFSKNVLHGFVFAFFFVNWMESDGPRAVFLAVGGIHLGVLLATVPLYVYGKRARMWTVRRRMMAPFE